MRSFETDVQKIKYKVLRAVAEHALNEKMEDVYYSVPLEVVPGRKPTMRCCVYKERAIVGERVHTALGGDRGDNVIQVIDIACDECPVDRYTVSNACRGCLAHRCMKACPKGAISRTKSGKMEIDPEKCIHCGRCAKACPYEAITENVRPCERACKVGAIKMNEEAKTFELAGKTYKESDWISIDGSTGNIYGEKIKTAAASISGDFDRLMTWADKFRRLQVRTNADTPHDAQQAAAFGAEGIGLCRTEHMFFEADRIKAMREMIVSETSEQRERALAKLEPIQQADFEAIYEAMKGRPVTIRLLDPPLHEFVPTDPKDIEELAKEMNLSVEHLKQVISSLHEFNPMMGHRGCRLDVTFPEIAKMQTAAIIKAALAVRSRRPAWKITPEIMVPLVGEEKELAFVKSVIDKTAKKIIKEAGSDMTYKVGTMIEIPRAALTADAIANEAEFFSFGTNDLTQMTFGFSRDDAGKFLA